MAAPQTTQSWTVEGQTGFDSLKFNESKAVPAVGDSECLVKIQGASLNYRDLIIPMVHDSVSVNKPKIFADVVTGQIPFWIHSFGHSWQ